MLAGNIAHRGARSLAPENTLLAFEKAWDHGADAIEVDVQVLADGTLVIHHDATLARTTNVSECFPERASQPITTFIFDEIRTLDAGSWFIDSDPFSQISSGSVSFADIERMYNLQIPTLEEVLLYVKDKNWRVNLELKKVANQRSDFPLVEEVLKLIKHHGIDKDQFAISSYHHPYIDEAKHQYPEIEINALIGHKQSLHNNWNDYSYQIYNANAKFIDQYQVEKAREKGCTVNLYTVNDVSMMMKYFDWGVNALITDYPQILQKCMKTGTNSNRFPSENSVF